MCYYVIDGSKDGEVVERRVCHSNLLDQQQQLAPLVCSPNRDGPCHQSQVKCPTDSLLLYITPSLHNLNIHLPFLSFYRMLQLYMALASCRLYSPPLHPVSLL